MHDTEKYRRPLLQEDRLAARRKGEAALHALKAGVMKFKSTSEGFAGNITGNESLRKKSARDHEKSLAHRQTSEQLKRSAEAFLRNQERREAKWERKAA